MIDWQSRIEHIGSLKPGWDGYDAPTPTLEAITAAHYILNGEHEGLKYLTRLSANVNGGIGMTFKNPEYGGYRKVYLEIDQGGCAAAMFLNDGKIETCAVEDDFEGREKFYGRMSQFMINGESI